MAAHVTCAPRGFRLGVGHRELREECAQWGDGVLPVLKGRGEPAETALGRSRRGGGW